MLIFRFDDTNPEAEEEVYFSSIIEIVEWLGTTAFTLNTARRLRLRIQTARDHLFER